MERLTYRDADGTAMMKKRGGWQGEGIARLAAYEDTGLEPEQVKDMVENAATCLMTWFESQYGLSIGVVEGLLEAKQQGRLVVLPCSIGTHLWKVTRPYRQEPKVTEFVVKNLRTAGKRHQLQLEVQAVNTPGTNWMPFSAFKRTREEAERALEGGADNG